MLQCIIIYVENWDRAC